jgi:hypothetical protein
VRNGPLLLKEVAGKPFLGSGGVGEEANQILKLEHNNGIEYVNAPGVVQKD